MGHENHHHHHHHQNLLIHHRSTFLPMLCSRPSIKDVSLPRWIDRSAPSTDDPLSPRIGCMGQVKRNNKIAGLPTSHRFSLTTQSNATMPMTTTSASVVKYSKLKRLFSTKNIGTTTTAAATAAATTSCGSGSRRRVMVNSADVTKNNNRGRNEDLASISIADMDPPLPVIKKVQKSEEGNQVDSLWKRRSGGAALKSLQLTQIHHHQRHHLQPTSV